MKVTVLTFFLILSAIVNVCAQKANVTISEPTYVKGRTGTKLILGEKDGKIFIVSQYGKSDKNPTLYLESYDAQNLKQIASKKVDYTNNESLKADFEPMTLNDDLYLSYTQRYKNNEAGKHVHQPVLTPVTVSMTKPPKELDYFPSRGGSNGTKNVFFKQSKDSTKLILISFVDGKEISKDYMNQTLFKIIVYNNALNPILKKDVVINVNHDEFSFEDFDCDENENVIMHLYAIDRKPKDSTRPNARVNDDLSAYINKVYLVSKSEKNAKEFLISKKDHIIRLLKMVRGEKGNITFMGFYSFNDKNNKHSGMYFLKLDGKKLTPLVEKFDKSSRIISDRTPSTIIENVDIIPINQEYYVFAKVVSIEYTSRNTSNGPVSSPSAFIDINILTFRFSTSGDFLGEAHIPRYFRYTNSLKTFTYTVFDDIPIFFYYDAPEKTETSKKSDGRVYENLLEDASLVMTILDREGGWKKQDLTPALKGVKPLNISDARRLPDGSLIFISGEKEDEKLVKITLTN